MDNLKFFTVFHPPNEVSSSGHVSVHCTTRKNQHYEYNIVDWTEIQAPKPFLQDDVCRQIVMDNIHNFGYEYDEQMDNIVISYSVIGDTFVIEMTLSRVFKDLDLGTRISELEQRLDELEPYEIIHEHMYPTWNSLDEFRTLPDFKYFEALRQWQKYIKPIPNAPKASKDSSHDKPGSVLFRCSPSELNELVWMHLIQDKGFNVIYREFEMLPPRIQPTALFSLVESDNGRLSRSTHSYVVGRYDKDIEFAVNTMNESKQSLEWNSSQGWAYFIKSAKQFIPEPYKISYFVFRYFYEYLTGWALLHPKLVAFRTWKSQLRATELGVTLTIYRSKRTSIFHENIKHFQDKSISPRYLTPGLTHSSLSVIINDDIVQ